MKHIFIIDLLAMLLKNEDVKILFMSPSGYIHIYGKGFVDDMAAVSRYSPFKFVKWYYIQMMSCSGGQLRMSCNSLDLVITIMIFMISSNWNIGDELRTRWYSKDEFYTDLYFDNSTTVLLYMHSFNQISKVIYRIRGFAWKNIVF